MKTPKESTIHAIASLSNLDSEEACIMIEMLLLYPWWHIYKIETEQSVRYREVSSKVSRVKRWAQREGMAHVAASLSAGPVLHHRFADTSGLCENKKEGKGRDESRTETKVRKRKEEEDGKRVFKIVPRDEPARLFAGRWRSYIN